MVILPDIEVLSMNLTAMQQIWGKIQILIIFVFLISTPFVSEYMQLENYQAVSVFNLSDFVPLSSFCSVSNYS